MDQIVQGDPNSVMSRLVKIIFLTQLKPTTSTQFVACSDIGAIAALALRNRERYIGQVIDIAGDKLSPRDMADGWREVFGEEMRPKLMGGNALAWATRAGMVEFRTMFKFFNSSEGGWNVDIPALRAQYPELKDRKTFLRTEVQNTTSS
ncbi:hypothetical protein DFH07DRAFT_825135 [Mycena maculata]|uniref:NmrA-like domain-containing protein n=1 Tax=Mycena maculata TaxID=230809 RepID=A0AAD7IXW4_9AGAR|nr:hypothetical protein DFH07DRAFT_825135 [Mycena maculata]